MASCWRLRAGTARHRGRHFPTICAATLNTPYGDYAIRGQGEATLCELLDASLSSITPIGGWTMPSPEVSVILPVFNRLRFLPDAVASVFAQTFTDWEMVIADDGSEAETRSYLQSLANPGRVELMWLSHSGNPGAVRNAALRKARGAYVAFLDSDDVWWPRKLELQMGSLRAKHACGWSYTAFVAVDESLTPLTGPRAVRTPMVGGWILDRLVTMEATIALPSVVGSRRLLERAGGFDEALRMCEDYDLWLRMAALSEIDCIDEPLLSVRRHREHSGSDILAFEDMRQVLNKLRRSESVASLQSAVRRRRALVSAGLAASHAASGHRLSALRTLASSPEYSWIYRDWWRRAVRVMVQVFLSWRPDKKPV
jgi:glycosyltransferase involved in cell wall biosynthesis